MTGADHPGGHEPRSPRRRPATAAADEHERPPVHPQALEVAQAPTGIRPVEDGQVNSAR